MSLNTYYATTSIAGSQTLPLHSAKVEACLAGLHKRADVDSTAQAIVALVSRELDSEPRQTLRKLISTTCLVMLARTTRECYASLAALHASVCISIVSAVPSYVHDPAICTAAGATFSTRQLVHYQILAAMRDAWHNERKTVGKGSSLRRVTLCAFVDELWCRRAATDRLLYDYLGLLCLSTSEGLDLEMAGLCHILYRRGRHLWRQPDSRPHIDELCKRLSAARKCIEGPSLPFDMLTKLDELRRRGWTSASDAPTGLTALKEDPAFRALLSRLGAISRDNVCSRWVTLGWPIESQEDPSDSLPPGQQDQWLTSRPSLASLPKLDTNVDISLSMTAPILQLSWETFDIVVVELARWACRCDGETYPMSSLIRMLERNIGCDSSWRLLYERVIRALIHVPDFQEEFLAPPPTALPVFDGDDSEGGSYADADGDTTAVIRALLGVLTTERFTSVSDQIVVFVNNSAGEAHAETLVFATQAIVEAAMEDEARAPLMARLCRYMAEQISDGVVKEEIKNAKGQPIKGGLLFRKYLVNRCQEDFERAWAVRKHVAVGAKAASQGQGSKELYSDEYDAAQMAKRHGPGLALFLGELFKLQMLTERIMHECVKELLRDVDNPDEKKIESICKLLSTVGQALDTSKARSHMDIYFKRMRDLSDNPNIDSRMKFMLQDVIELRERKWIPRNATVAPTTVSAVKDQARVAKAGDLSQFGKISTSAVGSVFAGKKRAMREHTVSLSRINPFAALTQNPADAPSTSRSRETSMDFSQSGLSEGGGRRKLQLLPRRTALEEVDATPETPNGAAANGKPGASSASASTVSTAASTPAPSTPGTPAAGAKMLNKVDVRSLFMKTSAPSPASPTTKAVPEVSAPAPRHPQAHPPPHPAFAGPQFANFPPHMRPGSSGPPRSPQFNRAVPNGMPRPPGPPGAPQAMGSPRLAPQQVPPGAMPPPQQPTGHATRRAHVV